ncbi:MAG: DegT/DnrJ/EryC1/StrS family aminotransferase [Betaproteobacteria bacterium]|nr:DegT/DnrJ/EryC1/StrS family aminotransferase [Betaproteobacteria bacterium]
MVDPAGEYRQLKEEIDAAVLRVLASGRYILGPEGEALEKELASYTGAAHAVGVNSGTDALHLALVAAGVGPGDEVVVPAFTFFASAEAVSYTGATPVFCDIELASFNIDPPSFEKSLTARTKALIAVHLFGRCARLPELVSICKERNIVLIEDCAQSLGADHAGRRGGSWGAFGCFSFYPTKNLGAAGDAGLVTTSSAARAETLRMLRHHGSRKTYLHERVGWNSRLDELQAAVLRVKLRHLERFNAARVRISQRYRERLKDANVILPSEPTDGRHAWHQFTIRSERRDAIREALAAEGIASSVFYPIPLHRQPAYEPANRGRSLPAAEEAARTVLSLPIHPLLEDGAVARIAEVVRSAA